MTRSETVHFLEKIKTYYQNFVIEDYVVNEWHDRLKSFDIEDVYKKLDEHLRGSYKDEIPKLHFITKYLNRDKDKLEPSNVLVRCNECGQAIGWKYYDEHLARHNSINYIKLNEKRINKTLSAEKLCNLNKQNFDEIYMKFLQEIYVISTDLEEKERIEKIIFVGGI